ncbi:MAG: hypothetical protein Q8N35_14330 [Methylococcaceae bacterium]|nr:hypothetical protein [Methylococcaceae bacterium]MDZ4156562.1 hypothetical protein [Methylococcales bacterium]MDP2393604.1 hypothetical protein [Methylococcaceae bacterium]MDP3020760.1 hypothetical protein [Methylococcaceae bacterium]MDP3390507.1 hypothetical protein [Methylococcaceae bacterium]
MNKFPISLIFLALLSACAPKEYFRTNITETPCKLTQTNSCDTANLVVSKEDDFKLGFVEIDDQGQFYDNAQVDALIKLLKTERQQQYVTIYVHGWHHNASDNDFNVRRFKERLKETKQQNPDYNVTGIYVGWRGETLDLPWLRLLTFWDRKVVSEEVGRNSLLDFLLRVESIVKAEGSSNKLLTIGHSLGASVIFNSLHQVLLQRLAQPENAELRSGFGDLVVLVNPAFEAIRFAAIREAAQRHNREYTFSDRQNPLLIIATSEADSITKDSFAFSRKLTAMFEQHRAITPDKNTAQSNNTLSEWELDTTAVGHFNQFITHRLEANASPPGANFACSSTVGWLSNAVARQKYLQLGKGEPATGEGWDTGNGHETASLFQDSSKMELRHLKNSASYDPYWVMQTDKSIIPNHAFINQKHLWCFIDQTMKQAMPDSAGVKRL